MWTVSSRCYLGAAERDRLDPILDVCADLYKALDENARIEFKSAAKEFVRTYGFWGRFCHTAIPNGKNCPSL